MAENHVMSSQTTALLEAFESLPDEDKRIFAGEFLRRVIPYDSGPLDDEETAHAADQIMAALDSEEAAKGLHDICVNQRLSAAKHYPLCLFWPPMKAD